MKSIFTKSYADLGLLILRVGLGMMFMVHGFGKVTGGPDTWSALGGAMGNLGITVAPVFWGFMAAITEFGGGILLALGLLHRMATPMLAFTMLVAVTMHVQAGDPFVPKVSYPLELMIVFVALALTGPGRFSLDHRLFGDDSSP